MNKMKLVLFNLSAVHCENNANHYGQIACSEWEYDGKKFVVSLLKNNNPKDKLSFEFRTISGPDINVTECPFNPAKVSSDEILHEMHKLVADKCNADVTEEYDIPYFKVEGYDKDNDVYETYHQCDSISNAIEIANQLKNTYLKHDRIKRYSSSDDSFEPIDWLIVTKIENYDIVWASYMEDYAVTFNENGNGKMNSKIISAQDETEAFDKFKKEYPDIVILFVSKIVSEVK